MALIILCAILLVLVDYERILISNLKVLIPNISPIKILKKFLCIKFVNVLYINNLILVDNFICLQPHNFNFVM